MRVRNPLPQLDIHSTRAQIEVHREPLRLTVESTPTRMRVRRTRPQFKVNTQTVSQAGRGAAALKMRQRLQHRLQQNLIGSNYVQDEQLQNEGAINPDQVATVTLHNNTQQGLPEISISDITASSAKIDWDPGSLEIEWDPHRLEMSWEGDMQPQITVTPHSVEIRLIDGRTVRVKESEAKSLEKQGFGTRVDKKV